MKKLLLTLTLLLTLGFAASAEVTISYSDFTISGKNATATKNDITIIGYSSTTPAISNQSLRVYANGTITVSSETDITKIVLHLNSTNYQRYTTVTPSVGTISQQNAAISAATMDENITWTGSAKSVTFTIGAKATLGTQKTSAGQLHVSSFDVTAEEAGPATPEITAASGETVYEAGVAVNEVAKGTQVTFTVTNCDDANISADPELTFTNGVATATIDADVTYTIMAGDDVIEEFKFKVVKPEITADKIIIKANGEAINAEDIELYAGTELTFDYADAIEGIIFSYTTDAETYTTATSYIFNPGEENDVALFVKAELEGQSNEKPLTITKKAVAAPTFSVEDGNVPEGSAIEVSGENVAWTVSKNGGEAEPVSGKSYTVNDEAGTALTFAATASVTLNGITTTSQTATLNVTVAEKTEAMYDFNKSDAYGLSPKSGDTNTSYETEVLTITTDPIVTVTVSGTYRLVSVSGEYALRLHATKNNKGAGRLTVTVPSDYYITGITFGTGSSNTNTPSNAEVTTGTSVSSNKWDMGGLQLSEVYIQRNNSNPTIKTMTVSYAKREPSLVEESTDINITHGKVAGVLTIVYSFEIANHSGNEVVVTATINGKEHITFTKVETPAAAPAREAAENGNWMEHGTLTAKHEDLKGAQTLNINVKATLDGKELYNEDHTPRTTTGIEDVTVEGNEAAEYFNLQGIRVAEPQAGQVYIVRRGAKTTKELVK